jgi:hypothetical protein
MNATYWPCSLVNRGIDSPGNGHGDDVVPGNPSVVRIERTRAMDDLVSRFCEQRVALPSGARELGGRLKGGMGDYYRHLLASRRDVHPETKEARWTEGHKDDDYAHAELYAMRALDRRASPWPDDDDDEGYRPIVDLRPLALDAFDLGRFRHL